MDDIVKHFEQVEESLQQNRSILNQSDSYNGNHGDHMVAIFQVASQAARQVADADLATAMEHASSLLSQLEQNASAQLYAAGLLQFAIHFRELEVGTDDLEAYIQASLAEDKQPGQKNPKSGDVLKALLSGLAGWQSASRSEGTPAKGMDMGYLFDLGVAYLQAKQRSASKIEALAETAVSASPLGETPYRVKSGKLVIVALLQSLLG